MAAKYLFLTTSTREAGHLGNTEWLAQQAAQSLPANAQQTWHALAHLQLENFVDLRHTTGHYPLPTGDMHTLLQATMDCTDLVLVAPVYWYSIPAPLKLYLDHWSAWMRIPSVPFKDAMAQKTMHLITTSGDRAKAQPMIDSVALCASFLNMRFAGALWGKGGPPQAVQADAQAISDAQQFFAVTQAAR